MSEYKTVFKRILNEYDEVSINSGPSNLGLDDDTDPSQFDIKGLPDVGGEDMEEYQGEIEQANMSKKKLLSIINAVQSLKDKVQSIGEALPSIEEDFPGISKSTKTVAAVNQKLSDLDGEIQGFQIAAPANRAEEEAKQAREQQGGF